MSIAFTVTGAELSEKEKMAYVDYLQSLDINVDGEFVDLHYKFEPIGFERIRRITGYLVGTMDNWNSAKAAEEADRVKHNIPEASFERI